MKKSRLGGLDARTRMLMMALVSIAAMVYKDIEFLVGLVMLDLAVLLIGGVGLPAIWQRLRAVLALIGGLFLIQMLFRRTGEPLILMWDFPLVYTDGFMVAAQMGLRFLAIVLAAQILMEGEARDYLLGMVQLRIPYEIGFMVMTGIHFLPVLREEARRVYYSVQLRGFEIKKAGILKKIPAYRSICMPILVSALRKAEEMSIAMETRGLRAYPTRTYMRQLRMSKVDVIVMIGFSSIIVGGLIFWGAYFR